MRHVQTLHPFTLWSEKKGSSPHHIKTFFKHKGNENKENCGVWGVV